jgi:hypothetical protein
MDNSPEEIKCPKCNSANNQKLSRLFYGKILIWVLNLRKCYNCQAYFGEKNKVYPYWKLIVFEILILILFLPIIVLIISITE